MPRKRMDNNDHLSHDVMSEIQKLRGEILNKLNQQTAELEVIKKIAGKSHADRHNFVSENQPEPVMKTEEADASTDSPSSSSLDNPPEKASEIVKSFVLKHVFKNAAMFVEDSENFSEPEEHFGIIWCINLIHKNNNLAFYLHVRHPGDDWEIETDYEVKIIGHKESESKEKILSYRFKESSGYGPSTFLEWEEVKKKYLVDGSLTAEVYVEINETKGLRKQKYRSFDAMEVSDIALFVRDRQFYVNKTYLASQSSFFKTLLLGNFSESKKSEIPLTGIDPEDFHFFLEVLYGEPAIDESNVEGIALLADMYDAPTAIRRCEEFMIRMSKKSLKRKLHLADQYHLGTLKKRCLAGIKTSTDIRNVLPNNIEDLDHSTMAVLLEKAISIDACVRPPIPTIRDRYGPR